MKNMRKMLLAVATVAVAAASARAQALTAPAGQAYTIVSTADATAVNAVTYQWYRNNNPIAGATRASYTVPGPQAYGEEVQFYRLAKTVDCTGDVEKKSNTVSVTFTGYIMPPGGCKLVVSATCWADYNIDDLQTFATRADMYTKFYQWNRLTAYSVEVPITPAWNSIADTSSTWKVNPCPNNWRMPSQEEFMSLSNSGTSWVAANTGRGNSVPGRFYGYNHTTCQLPSNMEGCIFLPANGFHSTASLSNQNAYGVYWSSTQSDSANGYLLVFISTSSNPANTNTKAFGSSVRCVR